MDGQYCDLFSRIAFETHTGRFTKITGGMAGTTQWCPVFLKERNFENREVDHKNKSSLM
jgi:hypothetical protein